MPKHAWRVGEKTSPVLLALVLTRDCRSFLTSANTSRTCKQILLVLKDSLKPPRSSKHTVQSSRIFCTIPQELPRQSAWLSLSLTMSTPSASSSSYLDWVHNQK